MLSRRIRVPLLLTLMLVGVVLTPLTLAHTPASVAAQASAFPPFTCTPAGIAKCQGRTHPFQAGLMYLGAPRYRTVFARWHVPSLIGHCPLFPVPARGAIPPIAPAV